MNPLSAPLNNSAVKSKTNYQWYQHSTTDATIPTVDDVTNGLVNILAMCSQTLASPEARISNARSEFLLAEAELILCHGASVDSSVENLHLLGLGLWRRAQDLLPLLQHVHVQLRQPCTRPQPGQCNEESPAASRFHGLFGAHAPSSCTLSLAEKQELQPQVKCATMQQQCALLCQRTENPSCHGQYFLHVFCGYTALLHRVPQGVFAREFVHIEAYAAYNLARAGTQTSACEVMTWGVGNICRPMARGGGA